MNRASPFAPNTDKAAKTNGYRTDVVPEDASAPSEKENGCPATILRAAWQYSNVSGCVIENAPSSRKVTKAKKTTKKAPKRKTTKKKAVKKPKKSK